MDFDSQKTELIDMANIGIERKDWPRVCEKPKLKISNGNYSPYFLVSELDVGFLYPDKQIDGSFVKCCPKNNDHQIVFIQARPKAAKGNCLR
jgi:hypothetical protein